MTVASYGPYEHEADARLDVEAIAALDPRSGGWSEAKLRRLLDVCEQTGIRLGSYDRRVIDWVARWEPETVQAIAGLITRGYHCGARHGYGGGDPGE